MTKGTPASSQIVWLEGRVQELEAENERLRGKLADFRRFVKEQFGYEDALEKETSA